MRAPQRAELIAVTGHPPALSSGTHLLWSVKGWLGSICVLDPGRSVLGSAEGNRFQGPVRGLSLPSKAGGAH